ncbi:MAG TPA: AMIN domain-containing protein, partial [Allocoleopsis sp.]
MRVHWLLPTLLGAISTLVFSLPAEAARLQLWRFDQSNNRLTFSTDEQVQPRAQLISNPTRLVIDLPDTMFGRSQVEQSLDGAIRSIRVAQFDATTTRIVIEMSPGYTLDPQQVSVRGTSPTQWVVQLPAPQSETGSAETSDTNSTQTPETRTSCTETSRTESSRTETNQTATSRTETSRTETNQTAANRTAGSRSEAAPVRPIYA